MATATQGLTTQPMVFLGQPLFPNLFGVLPLFQSSLTGSWQINATDGTSSAGPVLTPAIANPQLIPLLQNVQIVGTGVTPTITWTVPDLTGFDIDRIRVRAADATRGQFFQSGSLSPMATSFTIPSGVLTVGQPVAFRLLLEDRESTGLENRSSTWSQAFTPAPIPEPGTLLLIGSGIVGMGAMARRRKK